MTRPTPEQEQAAREFLTKDTSVDDYDLEADLAQLLAEHERRGMLQAAEIAESRDWERSGDCAAAIRAAKEGK